jgi:16S rRNA (uracil1498-N3)-methyltransferase
MRTLILPAPLTTGDHRVADDEAHHAISVLRVEVGDALRVADGDGREGDAVVVAVERKSLVLRVDAVRALPAALAELLTVAVALPKGDRAGDLVRGLTELGVGAILPLRCNRGLRDAAPARLERIAAEALKQCRRARLPRLGPAMDIAGLAALPAPVIVCDRAGGAPMPGSPRPTTLVVGPEGGLDDGELAVLRTVGATPVRLAGTILRIETAALAAAAVWTAAWEAAP